MDVVQRLVAMIARAREAQPRALVAVDGPDCAGKTTLADRLAEALGPRVVRASIDGFHHPREVRTARGDLSPEGYYRDSFDLGAFRSELLEPFARGDATVRTAAYDYRTDSAVVATEPVEAESVLVVDGVFLLRPELRDRWTFSVYLHVEPATTLQRALVRDVAKFESAAEVERRYEARYLPGQALYRSEADPTAHADVVLDNTDPASPVVVSWRSAP